VYCSFVYVVFVCVCVSYVFIRYCICVSRAGPAEKGYNKNVTEKNNSRHTYIAWNGVVKYRTFFTSAHDSRLHRAHAAHLRYILLCCCRYHIILYIHRYNLQSYIIHIYNTRICRGNSPVNMHIIGRCVRCVCPSYHNHCRGIPV